MSGFRCRRYSRAKCSRLERRTPSGSKEDEVTGTSWSTLSFIATWRPSHSIEIVLNPGWMTITVNAANGDRSLRDSRCHTCFCDSALAASITRTPRLFVPGLVDIPFKRHTDKPSSLHAIQLPQNAPSKG